MHILNLTQHPSTAEQSLAGVVDLAPELRAFLMKLLTFDSLPSARLVAARAISIAQIASESHCDAAMLGGAPYLITPLHVLLHEHGITPLYAFSIRQSIEEPQPDGSVRKINVFRHGGFVNLNEDDAP